jgi:Ni/Co efflux regulator RcnB
MKKTLLAAIIAATALVPPALAQDRGGRWGGGRPNAGSPAPQSGGGGQRQWNGGGQRQWNGGGQRQWNGGGQANGGQPYQGGWRRGGQVQGQAAPQPQVAAPVQQPQAQSQQRWGGNRGQWNGGNRGQWNGGDRRPDGAQAPQQFRGDRGQFNRGDRGQFNRGNPGWNGGNRGWNGGSAYRGNDRFRGGWNNGWRSDRRYDWRGYRTTNRSAFRLPRYYAPYGWGYGYQRFGIGFTLSELLFAPQYWINDPYSYRLPEVDGPYRWVRYYNDALLVDIETGEVVDTIYDIFW